MDDSISRQAAIDAIRNYYDEFDTSDKSIEERIEDLPSAQPEPKWIPCSERLPEENMWTICQNDAGAMMIGKYNIEFGWMFPAYFDGIVAWMPRPEPWKGEKECLETK